MYGLRLIKAFLDYIACVTIKYCSEAIIILNAGIKCIDEYI